MNNIRVAKQLVKIAKSLLAYDFGKVEDMDGKTFVKYFEGLSPADRKEVLDDLDDKTIESLRGKLEDEVDEDLEELDDREFMKFLIKDLWFIKLMNEIKINKMISRVAGSVYDDNTLLMEASDLSLDTILDKIEYTIKDCKKLESFFNEFNKLMFVSLNAMEEESIKIERGEEPDILRFQNAAKFVINKTWDWLRIVSNLVNDEKGFSFFLSYCQSIVKKDPKNPKLIDDIRNAKKNVDYLRRNTIDEFRYQMSNIKNIQSGLEKVVSNW